MADIKRVKVPDGTTYDIKDNDAIASISYSGHTVTVTGRDGTVTQFETADTTYTASDADPVMDGTAASGTSAKYSREDHVHPSDSAKANLASPTFTGTPKAPTASKGTNTTQIATTAFVQTALSDVAEQTFVVTDDGNGNVTVTLT